MPMRLWHVHLPKPIAYSYSLQLQEAVLAHHFSHKSIEIARQKGRKPGVSKDVDNKDTDCPAATLLTFQTNPTYTIGRRHLKANPLSLAQIEFLTSKSLARLPTPLNTTHDSSQAHGQHDLATFYPSPRGGLLTYHGPGQLTAYLIYNLRHHDITPRCHIRVLENAIMRTCAIHGVANTMTTDDPGVWIGETKPGTKLSHATGDVDHASILSDSPLSQILMNAERSKSFVGDSDKLIATNRKICAIGVHVSRGVTSHGIGLNVFDSSIPPSVAALYTLPVTDTSSSSALGTDGNLDRDMLTYQPPESNVPAPGYLSWGFSRIIACGLEGKSVTWLSRERSDPIQGVGQRSNPSATHKEPHTSPSSEASISVQSTPSSVYALGHNPDPNIMEQIASTLSDEICKALTQKGKITMDGVQRVSEEQILSFRSTAKPAGVDVVQPYR